MAIYSGTSANNSYSGTSDADSIVGNAGNDSLLGNGGNDTIHGSGTLTTTNLDLNWNAQNFGIDGTSLSSGFTQNTGGINVGVSYTDLGPGTAFRLETSSSNAGYVAPGETYNAQSNAYLAATGTGDASRVTFNFSAVSGSGLQDEVTNVAFRMNDIDGYYTDGWIDKVRLVAYDAAGNEVPVTLAAAGNDVVSGQSVTASDASNSTLDADGSVLVRVAGPVARIELVYGNGLSAGQFIQLSDVQFVATSTDMDTIYGGDGDDYITGGSDEDLLFGDAGNDTIYGGTGRDTIEGGAGNDSLFGEDGNDSILGGAGNDYIDGGAGADRLDGGAGADSILGGLGNDSILGGAGNDTLLGGDGADTISGGDDNDLISGGAGHDSLSGDAGNDTLRGDDGNDTLIGGDGDDLLDGGTGDDHMQGDAGNDTFAGGAGADTLAGGMGMDWVDYAASGAGVNVNLSGGVGLGGDAQGDSYSGLDAVIGSAFNDTLIGYDGDSFSGPDVYTNILSGGAGDDYIDGMGGADSLYGGTGNDTIYGGSGDDYIEGGAGIDHIYGGTGADTIFLTAGESAGDVIDGSEDSADEALDTSIDTIIINGRAKVIYDPNDSESGTIRWANGDTTAFTNIEKITHVPCFTPGTMIETLFGPILVEDIQVGQKVLTRDNGYQVVRWVGRRDFTAADLRASPSLCPVHIAAGALGDGLPHTDMCVSPQHRMLVGGVQSELLYGESEVLAAALYLVGQPGITRLAPRAISYLHVMFDEHEIVLADGAWTESFQPGDQSVAGMDDGTRAELFEIFPQLRDQSGRRAYGAARLSLKAHEVRVLLAA